MLFYGLKNFLSPDPTSEAKGTLCTLLLATLAGVVTGASYPFDSAAFARLGSSQRRFLVHEVRKPFPNRTALEDMSGTAESGDRRSR